MRGPPKRTRGIWYGQLTPLSPRRPFGVREKSAYFSLRRLGYSINQIAAAFGRSTSVVHRALKKLLLQGVLRRVDIRKLPYKPRMLASSFRWARLLKLLSDWKLFAEGVGEKPP